MGRSILARAIHLIRYRFLLFAGILPFMLGQAIAWHGARAFDFGAFLVSLVGLAFVLIGVEAFNEYFDARIGTDRVFSLEREEVPRSAFLYGLAAFAAAFVVMLYLTGKIGWQVSAFAAAGAVAACFYVTPPAKLAYRGLGEIAILSSYGPMMTAGSYFVQARRLDLAPFIASAVPALLILCVTVMNEIPDFYGDRIVGKRNITVRMGRERVVWLYGLASLACFVFIMVGAALGFLPRFSLLIAALVPWAFRNFSIARQHIDNPQGFIPAIRGAILIYTIALILLIAAYLI